MFNKQSTLYLLPLLSFFLGFFIMRAWLCDPSIKMPKLVGSSLVDVCKIASSYQLNIRITDIHYDNCLDNGMVLKQVPEIGSLIKKNQSIYLVISQQQEKSSLPSIINKTEEEALALLSSYPVVIQKYYFPHISAKSGTVFAYQDLEGKKNDLLNTLILYIALSDNNDYVIWPNFAHKSLLIVKEFLQNYNINPYITYKEKDNSNGNGVIVEQRPLAGSVIKREDISKAYVQLRVE